MYYGSFFFKYTHVLYINATYCRQYVIYIYMYIYIYTSHMFMDTILVGGHPLFDFHTRGPSGETR